MMKEFDSMDDYKALLLPGCGKHFGALVCTDGTVYKAFSGQLFGSYHHPSFVGPCIDDAALALASKSAEELHSHYRFYCFDGAVRGLYDNAPTGTGDCCEPKLLSWCYEHRKKPLSMACFYYGNGSYEHKSFTTPCESRCKKLLPIILGLDIVYLDSSIVVVNKPAGILSIEGKGPDKQDCIASRVKNLFPSCISQPCVHRLDMATSGLLVLALTQQAHDKLSLMFENRLVSKTYKALVHGAFPSDASGAFGQWILKQRLDVENRPLQIVDPVLGKEAITLWRRIATVHIEGSVYTKLELKPQTGRTHQLRLACKTFGHPIAGDPLYGDSDSFLSLQLRAVKLEFVHPVLGKPMSFEVDSSF